MSEPPENTPTSAGELRRLRNVSTYVDPFLVTKLPAEGTVSGGVIRLSDRTILGFVNRAFPDGTRVRVIYQEWLYAEEIPAPVEQPAEVAPQPAEQAAPSVGEAPGGEAEPEPAERVTAAAAGGPTGGVEPEPDDPVTTAVPGDPADGVEPDPVVADAVPDDAPEPAITAEDPVDPASARPEEAAASPDMVEADAADTEDQPARARAEAFPAPQPPVGYIEDDSRFDDSWEPPAPEALAELGPDTSAATPAEPEQSEPEWTGEHEESPVGRYEDDAPPLSAAGPAASEDPPRFEPADPEPTLPAQATERLVEDTSYSAAEDTGDEGPSHATEPEAPEELRPAEPAPERADRRTDGTWRGQGALDFEDFGAASSRSWGREWQPEEKRKPRRNRDGAESGTKVTVRRRRKSEEFPDDLSRSNDGGPANGDDPWTAAFRPRRGRRDED